MKSYRLMCCTLGGIQAEPRTTNELAAAAGVGYIPMVKLIAEFRRSGLIHMVARRPTRGWPAVYGFKGGEAVETGREHTRRFLTIWNAMLEPDSARAIAEECGLKENHVRRTIHAMRNAKLCRIADWQRGRVATPTALFAIGSQRDAPRPKPQTEHEYYLNQKRRRRDTQLQDVWRVAA
jgi:hypothetical protein